MTSISLLGAERLRQMLQEPNKIIVCPGVYDGLTARLALNVGFDAIYMTGAGTSMSRLGWADLGLTTLNDMKENAEMIASLDTTVPVIADADTGYGGPNMVARTVIQYARAGVAALHLEDQVQTKRCGHLLGKELVDEQVYISRIKAATAARNKIRSRIVIIARTDALASLGFDAAVKRLQSAVDAGADVVFLEGIRSKEEGRKVCESMSVPVVLNMVPGGVTPMITAEEAKELGFKLMICPSVALEAVYRSTMTALKSLKTEGKVDFSQGGPKELFMMCGLQECMDIDKAAGGSSFESI
ncbi:MAG: hypothetical protein M1834_009582 [Cirrosporium novae-zelandiae]|nr:MAG: hypothetical protein M1834_009582 [Cirrosporium novae-zelandiae]